MKHRIVQALAGLLVLSFACRAAAEDALPSGYTRIGWIQSTSTFTDAHQWIITDYTPKPTERDSIEIEFNVRNSDATQAIFASRGSTLNADNYSCLADGSYIRYDFGCWTNAQGQAIHGQAVLGSQRQNHTLKTLSYGTHGETIFFWDRTARDAIFSNYPGEPKAPITLFAAFFSDDHGHYDLSTASAAGAIRISRFTVYTQQGVLKRNFVAARDDNQPNLVTRYGLYETVQGKFFPNEGRLPFVVPAGVELPEGYTALEYVKPVAKMNATTRSAAGGAYVDTGYVPKANSLVQCGSVVNSDTTTQRNTIFGVRGENPVTAAMTWQVTYETLQPAPANPVYKIAFAGADALSPVSWLKWNAETDVSLQGATARFGARDLTATNRTEAATAPNGTLYLGAAHQVDATGANVGCADYGTAMIFFFRVFEDDELKVNLLPCRNSSNVIGFYDTIRKSFHPAEVANGGSVAAGETGVTLKSGNDATGADVVLALPQTGTRVTLPGATYARDGFVQVGWSKSADGSTLDNNFWVDVSAEEAVTLYPVWAPNGTPRYVQSDGTQVIDLGFPLKQDMEIELVMTPMQPVGDYLNTVGFFGARAQNFTTDGHAIEVFAGLSDFAVKFDYDFVQAGTDYTSGRLAEDYFSGKQMTVHLGANLISSLVEERSSTSSKVPKETTDFTTPCNAWLFGVNMSPLPNPYQWFFAKARFYSLTITQGGVVTHRFLPAAENGVVGVRDIVGNGGFRSPLTGEGFAPNPLKFGPGDPNGPSASLAPVPPIVMGTGMRRVDAVVSDGSQVIDLGMPIQSGWTVEMDFEFNEIPESVSLASFGSRTSSEANNIAILYGKSNLNLDYKDNSAGGSRAVLGNPTANTRYTAYLSALKRELRTAAGTVLVSSETRSQSGWSTPSNAQLFNCNGFDAAPTNASMRVYRLRITEAGGLGILDYIPCLTSEGRVGFYDAVSGRFVPQTTGHDFTYGKVLDAAEDVSALRAATTLSVNDFGVQNAPVTAKAEVRSVLVPKSGAYVESNGSQFIDLGFKLSSDMKITINFSPMESAAQQVAASGILGARSGPGSKNISIFLGNNNKASGYVVAPDLNNDTSYETYRDFPLKRYEVGALYTVEFPERKVYKNGNLIAKGKTLWPANQPFTTASNAHLFDVTDTGWAKAKIRFYSLIIETNGVEMCHFVPAVRDGHVGIEDIAGDKGFKYPENSGEPLGYSAGGFSGQHEFTEEVVLTAPGEVPFKAAPLKPGTVYDYVYSAENDAGEPMTFKGQFEAPAEAWPASYTSLAYDFPEKNPKSGKLTVILSRSEAEAADQITAVYGSIYGGADPAKWQHSAVIGQFGSGEASATVTLALPKDTVYLRFYTAAGGWSETVFIPETKFVPGKQQGLVIIVQ